MSLTPATAALKAATAAYLLDPTPANYSAYAGKVTAGIVRDLFAKIEEQAAPVAMGILQDAKVSPSDFTGGAEKELDAVEGLRLLGAPPPEPPQ